MSPGTRLNIVNNVVYGSGPHAQAEDYAFLMAWMRTCGNTRMDSNPAFRIEAAVVNTVTIPSLGTGRGSTAGSDEGNRPIFMVLNANNLMFQQNRFWLSGNRGRSLPDRPAPGSGPECSTQTSATASPARNVLEYESEPSWHADFNFQTIPTEGVTDNVFANAGARPLDRDPVDRAAVAQARAGLVGDIRNMGSRLRSQDDMGGHPTLAQNTRRLAMPRTPTPSPRQKFRTAIEMWLETLAQALEPAMADARKSETLPRSGARAKLQRPP